MCFCQDTVGSVDLVRACATVAPCGRCKCGPGVYCGAVCRYTEAGCVVAVFCGVFASCATGLELEGVERIRQLWSEGIVEWCVVCVM